MADQPQKNPQTTQAPNTQTKAQPAQPQPPAAPTFAGFAAQVVEVIKGRTGIYGEVRQVMCKILEGPDKGRVIRRNVAGRVKVDDILRLPDTSREAKQIRVR